MPRVNNIDSTAPTPLPQLREMLTNLPAGEFVTFPQSKAELMKVKENLTRRRHEIPGADAHLSYIEECLLAEARGQLRFVG